MEILKTKRLILRPWREEDLEPFAQLNADPKVMEFFPSTRTKEESDQLVEWMQKKIERQGWGWWAVEVPNVAPFIGFIGLNDVDFIPQFGDVVEVGWRLGLEFWGKGYATEGACACLSYGFETLQLKEIVSFTATQNMRSRAVMERIGMHRDPKDDFDHPKLPEGHPLRRHVLYRKSAHQK